MEILTIIIAAAVGLALGFAIAKIKSQTKLAESQTKIVKPV